MKKNIIIVSLSFIVLIELIFMIKQVEKNNVVSQDLEASQSSVLIYNDIASYPTSILDSKIKNGNKYLIFFGNGECGDCSTFYPILKKEIARYNIQRKIIYVNGEFLHKDKKKWEEFKKKYSFSQTPAFVLFDNGKVVSKIEWDSGNGLSEKKIDHWIVRNKKFINSIK